MLRNVVHEYYENLTYKQIVIIEKDCNDSKFSSNIQADCDNRKGL